MDVAALLTDAFSRIGEEVHGAADGLSAEQLAHRIDPDANLIVDPTLPQNTAFASLNLAWQFSERAMMGAEWLWGRHEDLTGAAGEAQRVQMTLRYDLNP